MKIHIAVATDQTMANLIPILAEPADQLILLVSAEMLPKVDSQIKAIKRHPRLTALDIQVRQNMPSSSVEAIQEFALNLLGELEQLNTEIIFNLAGGTKLMTLALYQVFSEPNIRQIYPNTSHNKIEILWPKKQEPVPLPDLLDAKAYLQTNGVTWRSAISEQAEWVSMVSDRQKMTFMLANQLAKATETTEKLIRQLNEAGAHALNKQQKLSNPEQSLNYVNRAMFTLLQTLAEHGMLYWDEQQPNDIEFCSEASVRYITGGWLEEYFFLVAKQVGLTDSHCSVQITDDIDAKANVRNELDGVIAHNNRLLLVECKTAKLGKDEFKDANIIYKSDSINKRIGGQYSTNLLLSALPLDHTTKDNREVKITARAQGVGIKILAGSAILNLKNWLQNWKETGKLE